MEEEWEGHQGLHEQDERERERERERGGGGGGGMESGDKFGTNSRGNDLSVLYVNFESGHTILLVLVLT